MKGLEDQSNMIGWIISNIVALLMLLAAWRSERLARLLFFLLFAWACVTNWRFALYLPEAYIEYASLSFLSIYRDFINGWFQQHTQLTVGIIACCQGLIAISMLLKGWVLKLGFAGSIIFLLAIAPLGVGSGFPTTVTMAVAMFIISRRRAHDLLWRKPAVVAPFIEMVD